MTIKVHSNIGFSLMRATEAAALIASRWVGRGGIQAADQAASSTMRTILDTIAMQGQIIIGERPQNVDMDILGSGVRVGLQDGPAMDVVVDSVEGVRLLAEGLPDAVSVVAIAPAGTMLNPVPVRYMEKLVVSKKAAHALRPQMLDAPPPWILGVIATALKKKVKDLTVFVLKRKRHEMLIEDIRSSGARVILRSEGDLVGAVLAATAGSGIDIMMGIGGASEGIVAACAVKALQGTIIARIIPRTPEEEAALKTTNLQAGQILSGDELVQSQDIFFAATGITDGLLLQGVRYHKDGATTHSMVLNGRSGIWRNIHAEHHTERLARIGV